MKKRKTKTIKIIDYGDEELTALALIGRALKEMEPEWRERAFRWFRAKYADEWPNE